MSQIFEVLKTFKLNVDGVYFYPGEHVEDLTSENIKELISKKCIKSPIPASSAVKSVKAAKQPGPKQEQSASDSTDDFTVIEAVTPEMDNDIVRAGFKTLEQIANAEPSVLAANVPGVNQELAEQMKEQAGAIIKAEAS